MPETRDRLTAIIQTPSRQLRLAEAALLVAQQEYPRLVVDDYLQRLDGYVAQIRDDLPPQPHLGDLLYTVNTFLFDEMGFTLQPEPDGRNPGFLHRLLDRGEGDATSLLILYLDVGRRLGLSLEGLSFSGHPLVRMREGDLQVVLDPLSGGLTMMNDQLDMLLSRACGLDHRTEVAVERLIPANDDREILIRMLRSLKAYYLRQMAFEKALWSIDTILSISPAATTELRDRAAIYVTLGYTDAAVTDYCHYLDQQPDAPDVADIRRSLGQLLEQRVTLH